MLMDHAYIQEHEIVSQYAVGKLDPADRVEFEDHLIDCPQCLDELELTDDFRQTLRSLESQRERPINTQTMLNSSLSGAGSSPLLPLRSAYKLDANLAEHHASPELQRPASAGRPVVFQRRVVAILAAVSVIVIGVVSFAFIRENRGIESQLDQARTDASTWERRYYDERQARTNAESQLREAPVASAPLFTLNLTRSANLGTETPSTAVSISRQVKFIVLSLELPNDPDFQSYRATLTDAARTKAWSTDDVLPATSEGLALILPASVIRAGKYVLTIEGRHGGQYSIAGSYSFLATQLVN